MVDEEISSMVGDEFIAAIDEAISEAENINATYGGEASDRVDEESPCWVPEALLTELTSADVMFSVFKSIAVQEGIDFIIARGRASELYGKDRAHYYTEAVAEGGVELEETEKLKAVMQRFLNYGSPSVQD